MARFVGQFEAEFDGPLEEYRSYNGDIRELKNDKELKELKEEKKKSAVEGGRGRCGSEGCQGKARRRCAGCNFAHYCGEECQRKAWGEHRVQCREIQEEFTTVIGAKVVIDGHFLEHPTKNTITKGAFKVQIVETNHSDQLLIHNNPRRGDGYIECTIPYDNLKNGLKYGVGCYMAKVIWNIPSLKTMTLIINMERKLPSPLWVADFDQSPFIRANWFLHKTFNYDW